MIRIMIAVLWGRPFLCLQSVEAARTPSEHQARSVYAFPSYKLDVTERNSL
jgi:hypothetical protein